MTLQVPSIKQPIKLATDDTVAMHVLDGRAAQAAMYTQAHATRLQPTLAHQATMEQTITVEHQHMVVTVAGTSKVAQDAKRKLFKSLFAVFT
jgi:hypothetical protein